MEKIVIEIQHPHRAPREYDVLDQDEIKIGRGYHNDIIIPDPYVSDCHAIIRYENGQWIVVDQETKNGVYIEKLNKTVDKIVLISGDYILMGKTRIRFLLPDHPVPATKSIVLSNKFIKFISRPSVAWSIVAGTLLCYGMNFFLENSEVSSPEGLITESIIIFIFMLIWSGLWAFVGRLIKHQMQFCAQMGITAFCYFLFLPAQGLSSQLGFVFSQFWVEGFLLSLTYGITFIFMLSENLSVATNVPHLYRWVASSVITFVVVSVGVSAMLAERHHFDPLPSYYATLKAPYFGIPHSKEIKHFIQDSQDIFFFSD
ncbi:MAG: FHA domain-containing protein [Candidatus Omnitrophica bacterium]|nr:FHA domain-containing protein [Candidatus Omnitrophota bacterium]